MFGKNDTCPKVNHNMIQVVKGNKKTKQVPLLISVTRISDLLARNDVQLSYAESKTPTAQTLLHILIFSSTATESLNRSTKLTP
jgi:hypothetical protein